MSTIRVIYEAEPDFPPSAQHPDAVRYQVGEYWVDAIDIEAGAAPAEQEIDAVLEALGRLVYQERREAREKLTHEVLERLKNTK